MSAKRPATQTINQKTLQYVEPGCPAQDAQTPEKERVIVQVKRDQANQPLPKVPNQSKPVPQNSEEKKDKPKPLFSNLFQNGNGVGLFGNVGIFSASSSGLFGSTASKEAPKIDTTLPNLFTGNGFTASSNTSKSLFGSNMANSGLGSSGFGTSIFGFGQGASIPPVRHDDQEQGDSAELQKELQKGQNMEVDKSKSKGHFEYKSDVKVLFSGAVRKYKKNNGDLVENVEIVLQHDPVQKLVYIVVRLAATKNSIFTGYILEGKSQARILNKKDENLEIGAFVIAKNKPAQLDRLKVQLDTPQNGKLLYNKLQQAITGKLVHEIREGQAKEESKDKESAKEEVKNESAKEETKNQSSKTEKL